MKKEGGIESGRTSSFRIHPSYLLAVAPMAPPAAKGGLDLTSPAFGGECPMADRPIGTRPVIPSRTTGIFVRGSTPIPVSPPNMS